MFRRIFLFVLTNIAIIIALNIVLFIVFSIFDIRIQDTWLDYVSLAIFAIVYGFFGAFISLQMSKWIAKRAYPMKIITDASIHNTKIHIVRETVFHIAQSENIKMPEIGIYQSKDPNAFATWPSKNNSLVAVSTALLDQMTDEEIRGVVAHEMAHIINGDMVTMTLLQWIINAFVIFFARALAFAIDTALSKGKDNAGSMKIVILWRGSNIRYDTRFCWHACVDGLFEKKRVCRRCR
jgi:heat shock protein HtpX